MKPNSSQECPEKGQSAQTEIQEILTKEKGSFYCKVGWILEQAAQKTCGVSMLGETQNSCGRGPEQTALSRILE